MLESEVLKVLTKIAQNLEPITSVSLTLTHLHQGPAASPQTYSGSGTIYDISCFSSVPGASEMRSFYLLIDSKLVPFQTFGGSAYVQCGYSLLGDFAFTTDIQVASIDITSNPCSVGFHARLR